MISIFTWMIILGNNMISIFTWMIIFSITIVFVILTTEY